VVVAVDAGRSVAREIATDFVSMRSRPGASRALAFLPISGEQRSDGAQPRDSSGRSPLFDGGNSDAPAVVLLAKFKPFACCHLADMGYACFTLQDLVFPFFGNP
jgi:hypothetical protein